MWRHWQLLNASRLPDARSKLWSHKKNVYYNDNHRKRYEQTLIEITTKTASFFLNLFQDLGAVSDVTSISRSIPEVDRTDFKVSNFPALYLRLTGSVFLPVKNVVFLMLRTFTRLSILNHRSFPLTRRFACTQTSFPRTDRMTENNFRARLPSYPNWPIFMILRWIMNFSYVS